MDICVDLSLDVCMVMRMDMCVDMYTDMHTGTCTLDCRHVYRQAWHGHASAVYLPKGHVYRHVYEHVCGHANEGMRMNVYGRVNGQVD